MNIDISDIYMKKNILQVNDNIKNKAIGKLKVLNNMQGDSKAQDWLDGLLKVPFRIYKTSSIMDFKNFINELNKHII